MFHAFLFLFHDRIRVQGYIATFNTKNLTSQNAKIKSNQLTVKKTGLFNRKS